MKMHNKLPQVLSAMLVSATLLFLSTEHVHAQAQQSVRAKATLTADKPNSAAEKTYQTVDKMPEFVGGNNQLNQYLSKNLNYPPKAVKEELQGRVISRFVVNKDGDIQDIEIVKSLSPECDAEVIRVLRNMPKWTPGKMNGKDVNVYYTLPFSFTLP